MNATSTTIVKGTVAVTNGSGFKIAEREGWLNFSKFGTPPQMPARGQKVAVTLNQRGYVVAVSALNGAQPKDEFNEIAPNHDHAGLPKKDVMIARMNALAHATSIATSGGQMPDLGTVLELAVEVEAWIYRP